jgi:hypothetical protein
MRADSDSAVEFSLSESGQRPDSAEAEAEGSGGGTNPVWVSTTDGAAKTGRLEGKCETDLSTVSAGRAGSADPEAEKDSQPSSGHGPASRWTEPTLEHGFHE